MRRELWTCENGNPGVEAIEAIRKSRLDLVFLQGGQLPFVHVMDIDWIEAAGYYACLHVGNDTHVMRRTLELERDLGEERFGRIHRSIIVNLERICALEVEKSGEYEVVLKNKARLRLSRRFKKGLQSRVNDMRKRIPSPIAD